MEIEKIRSLQDAELTTQTNQSAEQLFRLRFQKSLGNNEGVKKIRGLRKDIARFKTVARERSLGIAPVAKAEAAGAPKAKKTAAKKAPAKKAKKD